MSIRHLFPIERWEFKSESVLANLPHEELSLLTAHQSIKQYEKGEIIFREGAAPDGIFFIRSGKAKKYKVDNKGKEQIIYVANPGELIGYHAILSRSRYPDSASALETASIAFIPKMDFEKALDVSTILGKRLLKTLSHEFSVLINSVAVQSHRSVRERLALQLIVLREKYKLNHPVGSPIEINLSREDLGNLVGTARENIIRILAELKEAGIIITKGRSIIVQDVKKLIEISNYT